MNKKIDDTVTGVHIEVDAERFGYRGVLYIFRKDTKAPDGFNLESENFTSLDNYSEALKLQKQFVQYRITGGIK